VGVYKRHEQSNEVVSSSNNDGGVFKKKEMKSRTDSKKTLDILLTEDSFDKDQTILHRIPEAEPNRISERIDEEDAGSLEHSLMLEETKFDENEYEEINRVRANDGVY
jgi:hypothetical protein